MVTHFIRPRFGFRRKEDLLGFLEEELGEAAHDSVFFPMQSSLAAVLQEKRAHKSDGDGRDGGRDGERGQCNQ